MPIIIIFIKLYYDTCLESSLTLNFLNYYKVWFNWLIPYKCSFNTAIYSLIFERLLKDSQVNNLNEDLLFEMKYLSYAKMYFVGFLQSAVILTNLICSSHHYSFQPSPFFVLDEIDAALDNTNINRVWTNNC